MIHLILLGIGSLFIIPTLLRLTISLVGRGGVGVVQGVVSASRLVIGIGKYLLIPLAAFVLLAPDLWKSYLPGTSALIGVAILIVAALILLCEMVKGLGSALAISFWGIICVVIIGAFHLDKYIPKNLNLGPIQLKTAANTQTPHMQATPVPQVRGVDSLEYSSFGGQAARKPEVKKVQFLDKDLIQLPAFDYATIQETFTNALPSSADFFNSHDQSFRGLSSDVYFNSKGSHRQYYGYSLTQSGSSQGLGSVFDQPTELFKKFLGR